MKIAPIGEIDSFLGEEILTAESYLHTLEDPHESFWEKLDTFFLEEIGMR